MGEKIKSIAQKYEVNNKSKPKSVTLNYKPSQNIAAIAKMFERGIKFTPGNKKSEQEVLRELDKASKELKAASKELDQSKDNKDNKTLIEAAQVINQTTAGVIEKMAKNRIELKSGFFGLFRRSNLLKALVDNKICDPNTGEIKNKNFENFTKLSEIKKVPELGNSVMTKALWANIASGCSLANKLYKSMSNNSNVMEVLRPGDVNGGVNYNEIWKSKESLKKQIVPDLNIDDLCQKCNVVKKGLFSSSYADFDDWGKEETQNDANNPKNYLYSIKQNLEYYNKNLNTIKSDISTLAESLNLYDLIECYFRLMVLNQVCQIVLCFKVILHSDSNTTPPVIYMAPESKNENYDSYMSEHYPNLYNLDMSIYEWIVKQTNQVMRKLQYSTCIAAFRMLKIEISYESLPKEIKDGLSNVYKENLGYSEGSRPIGYNDFKEDVTQQTFEAIKVLWNYAEKYK